MKLNKSFVLYIPARFVQRLNEYIKTNPPCFKYDIVYFYYIVHYIFDQQNRNKNKNEESEQFVNINAKKLMRITTSNINDYIKYLKNGELIFSDNHYVIGEKSKGYCINPEYLKGIDRVEVKADCKLFDKIIKNHRSKRSHNNRLEPFLKRMNNELKKVELDYVNAEKWVLMQSNYEKQASYMTALELLKDNRSRYFHRNKTNNRLDTNFTNLKKDLKQFIIGNYVNIDLKNSQPFFLSQLLKIIIESYNNKQQGSLCSKLSYDNLIETFGIKRLNSVSKIHQKEEKPFLANLKRFNDSVLNGTLYDDFINTYSNGITRDEVKNIMFKLMFSKNELHENYKMFIPFEKEKKVFATVYPFVYDSIKALKENDNVILPVFLQKLESYIFIDCIAKELVETGIIPLTIHDSIIVKTEHKEKSIVIMNKVFKQNFNVIPTLKIELLKLNKF